MTSIATPTRSAGWVRAGIIAAVPAAAAAVALGALGKALGAAHTQQLQAGPGIVLSVIGVLVGAFAWSRLSGAALRRVVPAVVGLSFVPDLLLGATGTAWSAVTTLLVIHVAVAAIAVATFARLQPRP